jgi:hypothetical protein
MVQHTLGKLGSLHQDLRNSFDCRFVRDPHHRDRGPHQHMIEAHASVGEQSCNFIWQVGTPRDHTLNEAGQERVIFFHLKEASAVVRQSQVQDVTFPR